MAWRPRLPAFVTVAAMAGGLAGGFALSRAVVGGGGDGDEVRLDEPGEYQQPVDGGNRDVDGDALPDVVLSDADGVEVRTSALVGRPVVVNLWYSTCVPCKRELAELADVHREVGDRIRFVGVDPFDDVDVMQRFAAEREVGYELLLDGDRELVEALGVVSFPVTLFVDADGVIVAQTGQLSGDELRGRIDDLFAGGGG